MLSIGQEVGQAVGPLVGSPSGDHSSCAAGRRARGQPRFVAGREKNDAVFVPGSAATGRCVANNADRAIRNVDALVLSFGKEADEAAIGRPKRRGGSFGTGQLAWDAGIQLADPEIAFFI